MGLFKDREKSSWVSSYCSHDEYQRIFIVISLKNVVMSHNELIVVEHLIWLCLLKVGV